MDGKLDEEVYQHEQSFGDFVQVVPKYGATISEKTELWVMYDDENRPTCSARAPTTGSGR